VFAVENIGQRLTLRGPEPNARIPNLPLATHPWPQVADQANADASAEAEASL